MKKKAQRGPPPLVIVTKLISATGLATVALMTASALAVTPAMQMTGEAFSDACTRPSESWISFCNGYVQAVVDSIRPSAGVCIPPGTTRTDSLPRPSCVALSSTRRRVL